MSPRVWWLAVYDPTTGLATRPVGVVGLDEAGRRWRSWLPWVGAEDWRARVRDLEEADPAERLAVVQGWERDCDGISWAALEVEQVPESVDVAGAVEGCLDELLDAGWRAPADSTKAGAEG